jgi:glycosyltransferase involved in cell wall biosynthesis
MSSVKSCILTTVHPPFDGRIFKRQGVSLFDAGYNVSLIATHDKAEIKDGIRVVPIIRKKSRIVRMLGTLQAFQLALREKALVYHFHDPELIPIGLLLKFFTKAKIIYDVHEDHAASMLTKYYLPAVTRYLLMLMFDLFERTACLFFDHIIPATEGIQKRFATFSHKTTIVHNYPRNLASSQKTNPVDSPSSKVFTLICTGGFSEGRGTLEEVKCLGLIKDLNVRLKLIGKYQDPYFENTLRSMPEYDRVDYISWIPQEELFRQLVNADLGLVTYHPLPNMTEALPTKIFEYMAVGLPIVASHFPLWKKIVEDSGCGITVDPINAKEMALKIENLLKDGERRAVMSRNGRIAFENQYNWENEEKKLLLAYRKVCRQTKNSPAGMAN